MSYEIQLSDHFKKEAKRLIKKYHSLINELDKLINNLSIDPIQGIPIGNNIYKIRLSIASKRTGKSGGARVIALVEITDTVVVLLSIYSKGEKDDISDKELKALICNLEKSKGQNSN